MAITHNLLAWYEEQRRDLPWRGVHDPYITWVSEIMLQQTRVETVIPYFMRWMDSFPDVYSLAQADRQEVLSHWEGLGYYRRAHNLHRAAQIIVEEHGGTIPKDIKTLKSLPGIGDYTAAAIAALAFDQDVVALDGNLRRVLTRLFDRTENPRTSHGERVLRELGLQLLPSGSASNFNQALMDLGATICTPRSPTCDICPLQSHCLAYLRGVQEQRPVTVPREPVPHVHAAAAVIEEDGKVLIGRRPEDKLLGGLWEFPGGKQEPDESLEECLSREILEELGIRIDVGLGLGTFEHAYSHFAIAVHAFACRRLEGELQTRDHTALEWVPIGRLDEYPMGKVDRMIAEKLSEKDLGE
jgi:A/G-specific adenine glycosylase